MPCYSPGPTSFPSCNRYITTPFRLSRQPTLNHTLESSTRLSTRERPKDRYRFTLAASAVPAIGTHRKTRNEPTTILQTHSTRHRTTCFPQLATEHPGCRNGRIYSPPQPRSTIDERHTSSRAGAETGRSPVQRLLTNDSHYHGGNPKANCATLAFASRTRPGRQRRCPARPVR